jgi:hypothetical protein
MLSVCGATVSSMGCERLGAGCASSESPTAKTEPDSDSPARAPNIHLQQDGRWTKLRATASVDAELETQIRQLEALGYADGTQTAPSLSGVTVHDTLRVSTGFNFYTSGHGREAVLMDMAGRELHRWSHDFEGLWPNASARRAAKGAQHWRRAHLFGNGDILAVHEGLGLIKLDKDSKLLWALANGAHHDLDVLPDGDIAVLTRRGRLISRVDPTGAVLEDYAVILDSDGREKYRGSLLEAFERSDEYRKIWEESSTRTGDILHTNSIEVLDGRFADRHPALRAGNLLLSSRVLDTVFIVDPRSNEVVWALQAGFDGQHDARIVGDGLVMLFDNFGTRSSSSVEAYDPRTKKLAWEYAGSKERDFYSETCGAAQRLPNGNTLVTESDNGRAFEVTAGGETVWEFYNPHRAGDRDEFIATLFMLERLPPDFPVDWVTEP